ncbi:MAG TPA: hypothetical protein DCS19_04915 [Flavobacterium sp.]|nr:hypothetical protein [Flavobacterium sp.]
MDFINYNPLFISEKGYSISWQYKGEIELSESCESVYENNDVYALLIKGKQNIYLDKSKIKSIRFKRL